MCWIALSLLSLSLLASPSHGARRLEPVSGEATAFGLPQLAVVRTDTAPVIDGSADDPIWQKVSPAILVHAISGGRAPVQTTFRMAWDDDALYVFVRAVERGQESFAVGTSSAHDVAVHDGDAAEIFLQPAGPGTPYFQLAANPWGGFADTQWQRVGQRLAWQAAATRIAGQVDFDDWTVEVSIPFSDLGVPPPAQGDEWRANVCRNELPGHLLYAAWSSTGDGFQVPERFGRLQFVGVNGAAAGSTVRGQLRTIDDRAAIDFPVRAFGRVARTDSSGVFAFDGVSPGEQIISLISPAHETFHGSVLVDTAVVELAPIVVQPVDPYRPRWQLVVPASGVWLASSLEEPPDMLAPPGSGDRVTALSALAAAGEYESRAVSYLAAVDVSVPEIASTDLTGAGGMIPADSVTVRWTQRLLKRESYQTNQDHSEFVWRFLWPEPPARIAAGQLRQLVVTVHVPDGAAAGDYAGHLRLTSEGRQVTRLPLHLRVGSFQLADPDKRVGTFINNLDSFSDAWVELMLRDVRAHGGSKLKWWMGLNIVEEDGRLIPDAEQARKRIRLQHRLGFVPPYPISTAAEQLANRLGIPGGRHAYDAAAMRASEAFVETYGRFVEAAQQLEAEMDVGELALFWSDEIFQQGRLESWLVTAGMTRELTDQQIFITHHSGDREKIRQIDPYTDIRCYHGRRLDDDYPSGAAYDELAAELNASGDTAWAYYNVVRTDITSEFTRIVNGYWLWRTPVQVHVPWTYFYGDRQSMVGVREGTREAPFFAFAAPHPTRQEMVSSLDWECFREGFDDLRYLTTLEQAIDTASPSKSDAADRARSLLRTWWDEDPRVTSRAASMTGADYDGRRQQMFELIEALQP